MLPTDWGVSSMTGPDPIVLTAIRNATERHSAYEWWALPPRQRTEAVYAELRRLDARALSVATEASEATARTLADAVA
jgi:hypothetical protein